MRDYDCNNCKWLNIKENNQSKEKEPHICLRYNKRILHNGNHPYLEPLEECTDKAISDDVIKDIMLNIMSNLDLKED